MLVNKLIRAYSAQNMHMFINELHRFLLNDIIDETNVEESDLSPQAKMHTRLPSMVQE
jgi:hypothetical protein